MTRKNDGHPLREFLGSMTMIEQEAYARRCGTTAGYLRKYLSKRTKPDVRLVTELVRNSGGKVPFSAIRPDVDWGVVRALIPATPKKMPLPRIKLKPKAP